MKKVLGQYLFEVVVIFIGITLSFLFEEWRQNREKDQKAVEMMKSLLIELERNDSYISEIDSNYFKINASIEKFLENEGMARNEVVDLAYMLLEQTSIFRLNGISSFILGFSSQDQLNIITRNERVLSYLSYLENLLTEHELITNALTESASSQFWPLLNKYQLTDDVLNLQKEYLDFNDTHLDKKNLDVSEIFSDPAVREQLKWSQLKILRLIQINSAIHVNIENIMYELNHTIEGA